MIRFEVSGATAEEFAENAMKAWGLMSVGLHNALLGAKIARQIETQMADLQGETPSSTAASAPSSPASSSTPKVASDPVDDLFNQEDPPQEVSMAPMENPKATMNSAGSSPQTKKSKAPKLDDLKTRLSEVISAAAERWDVKRANAYARKLLKEVCAEKIGDIKPEEYGDFLALSKAYLDGVASETE